MASQKKVNMEILKLDIMLTYNYKNSYITNHMCNICKRHIMAPTHSSKNNCDLNCSITEGKCKHLFHTDCIDKYFKAGNVLCPIDMTPWNIDHIIDNNNTYKKLVSSGTDKIKNPLLTYQANKK